MFRATIYINGERLDTFEDENISINSSVQNISDISRVFNDFSESFTVPATPRNNRIFKHWYNFSIENGFDARVRHSSIIEVDTLQFLKGSIRLESSSTYKKKPVDYKLAFFGQLIDLNETIGDDYLNALDLSQYDITYNSANVLTGLTNGYSLEDYVFPIISTDKQYLYNSDPSDITEDERLSNIAWNGSGSVHGVSWNSLRPALKAMRIVEAIESRYGLTFSRDFLGNAVFDNLYLWLANQETEDALKNSFRATDFDSVDVFQLDKGNFNNSTGAYVVTDRGTSFIRDMEVRVDSSDNRAYTVQVMNNDQVVSEKSGSDDIDIDVNFPGGVQRGSQLYVRFVATAGKTIDSINFRVKELSDDTVCFVNRTTDITVPTVTAFTTSFLPQLKILDFLKSIVSSYNLTILPISRTAFEFVQLDDWYDMGSTYDISRFLDRSKKIPVERPKIYRQISFKNQKPNTILASQFQKTNNTAYGDLETKLRDADGKVLDGGEFEIETDFEQMVYEKLIDQNNGEETNVVYGLSLNDSLGDTLPSAHLLYIRKISVSSNPVGFITDTGTKLQISANVFMPSHANSATKEYSTTFGSEIDEHDGGLIQNSLFSLYYRDYITDSFSEKRRKIKVDTRLPQSLLVKLKLNDKLVIDGERFLINSMESNVTKLTQRIELLNDIFSAVSNIEEETTSTPVENDPVEETPQGKSFDISTNSSSVSSGPCSFPISDKAYFDGNTFEPNIGNRIFNDIDMSTPFDGGNRWWGIPGGTNIRISSDGFMNARYNCQQSQGGGSGGGSGGGGGQTPDL